jgi:hypothetical protein
MRLYDVEMSAQLHIEGQGKVEEDVPLFDSTKFGRRIKSEVFE